MRSTPHKQRARIYVQARPIFFLRLWAYFFARNLPHQHGGVRPLSMRGTPHSVEMQKLKYTAVRLPRVFIALCGGKHGCCSRRGSASRFFRTLSSTVPGGSRDKATTSYIMQTTASIQRTAQLRPLGIGKASIEAWLNAKSKVMTNMFGMEVTRLEGLRVYGAFGLMTVGAALSGVSLLVTALCVALAGYNVYKLNVEHPEEKGGEE